jgi:hypothetical protein
MHGLNHAFVIVRVCVREVRMCVYHMCVQRDELVRGDDTTAFEEMCDDIVEHTTCHHHFISGGSASIALLLWLIG